MTYNNLSNKELLREFEGAGQFSPVIKVLLDRLEAVTSECPCCKADINKAAKELSA